MPKSFICSDVTKNYRQINQILDHAMRAVDPFLCVKQYLYLEDDVLQIGNLALALKQYKQIYVAGIGKAVMPMANALQEILGDRLSGGLLISKHIIQEFAHTLSPKIKVTLGSHPLPDVSSVLVSMQMLNFLSQVNSDDLVIGLISGGGSSLMTLPIDPISLTDYQDITRLLLFCGASIHEMNCVRKHIDQLKGGGLLRAVGSARMETLVLSDVVGDDLDVIASGPTVTDPSTYQDALAIIDKYRLEKDTPTSVLEHLYAGSRGVRPETLKPDAPELPNSNTLIIGSLVMAAEAARKEAEAQGFNTKMLSTSLIGEAREVGQELAEILRKVVEGGDEIQRPACLIAGGETTVTVSGKGKGGRNQETALSAARVIVGLPDCLFISIATDGEDGPTDAAGGAVNGHTMQKGLELGLCIEDFLADNNAYEFLERTGTLVKTGPSGSNVNDLILMFAF